MNSGAYEGGKADATFSFKDDDFVKVAMGKMNPQIAFMRLDNQAAKILCLCTLCFASLSKFGWMQGCNEDQGKSECCTEVYA